MGEPNPDSADREPPHGPEPPDEVLPVVVARHGLDGRDLGQLLDRERRGVVAGVEDEARPGGGQPIEERPRQAFPEPGQVRVRDDPDDGGPVLARRQLTSYVGRLNPNSLPPSGRLRAHIRPPIPSTR